MNKLATAKRAIKNKRHKLGQKIFGKTDQDAVGIQADELLDARAGIVYFLGKCQLKTLPPTGTGVLAGLKDGYISHTDGLKLAVELAVKASEKTGLTDKIKSSDIYSKGVGFASKIKASKPVEFATEVFQGLKRILKELVEDFSSWLEKHLKSTYGYLLDAVTGIAEFIAWLKRTLAGCLADAAPGWGIVTSLSEMAVGLKQGFDGAKRWILQVHSGRGVHLLGGHPSVIANALARHSLSMLGAGIKDFSVGTAKLATNATPLGTTIGIVTGIIQRVYNLIDCFVQRFLVNRVLKKARTAWQDGKYTNSLITDADKFNKWFRNNAVATPVIAALVLSSGFIGHPQRFVRLLDGESHPSTSKLQEKFDAGVSHVQYLKKISAKYLVEYGQGYRTTFTSDTELVANLLKATTKGTVISDDV